MYPPPLGPSRGRSLRLLAALTVAAVLAACARTPAEPEIEVQTATDETIGAELPGVFVNVMRGGPGLGNVGPSQEDIKLACRGLGHGNSHAIALARVSGIGGPKLGV